MFIIIVYLISVFAWGLVLYDMIKATYFSIRYKTETPRLLVPLAISSLAIVVESAYFLIANIVKYYIGFESYAVFLEQDNLFIIKIGIALGGILMMFKLRSDRKKNK